MSRTRVIGIGTPFGDDRTGLELAARLVAAPPADCDIVATERPGVELLDLLAGAEVAILLDAVHSGAAIGSVLDLALADLPGAGVALSSHGISIADAVALAGVLGCLPRGRLIGIEADPSRRRIDAALSAEVAAALPLAVQRVHRWVDQYGSAGRSATAKMSGQ